jgi:hypothetical protein
MYITTDLPVAAFLLTKLDLTPQISWDSERKRATFTFNSNPQKIEGIVDLYFQGGEVPASKLISALSHLKTLLNASRGRGQVCTYKKDRYDSEYNRGRVR